MKKTIYYCDICKREIKDGVKYKLHMCNNISNQLNRHWYDDLCSSCAESLSSVIKEDIDYIRYMLPKWR